jgi:dephospho-CoA kinase
MNPKKTIIGILGGIGSGKSTVAEYFGKLGCAVINADIIARQYLGSPQVLPKLRELLGQDIILPDGKAVRKAIAEKVFNNPEKLKTLNDLIHPLVMIDIENSIKTYQKNPQFKAIILDVPLLLEVDWGKNCDYLIFIDSLKEKRLARAKKKGIITAEQLDLREGFQFSTEEKAKKADYVIDNNSDLPSLYKQIEAIFSELIV